MPAPVLKLDELAAPVDQLPNGGRINGKFAKGNTISRGNAGLRGNVTHRRMANLRAHAIKSIEPKKAIAVMDALYKMAVGSWEYQVVDSEGKVSTVKGRPDSSAAKVWMSYAFGQPRRDGDELTGAAVRRNSFSVLGCSQVRREK